MAAPFCATRQGLQKQDSRPAKDIIREYFFSGEVGRREKNGCSNHCANTCGQRLSSKEVASDEASLEISGNPPHSARTTTATTVPTPVLIDETISTLHYQCTYPKEGGK